MQAWALSVRRHWDTAYVSDGGLRQLAAGGAEGAANSALASQQRPANLDPGAAAAHVFTATAEVPASALLPSMVASSDDFYPTVALTALLAILRDDSLALHHGPVLQAVTAVLRGLGGVRCLPFLSRVIPTFLHVMRASAATARTSGSAIGLASSSAAGTSGAGPGAGVGRRWLVHTPGAEQLPLGPLLETQGILPQMKIL